MAALGAVIDTSRVLSVVLVGVDARVHDLLGVDPLDKQSTLGVILLLAVGLDAGTRVSRR